MKNFMRALKSKAIGGNHFIMVILKLDIVAAALILILRISQLIGLTLLLIGSEIKKMGTMKGIF